MAGLPAPEEVAIDLCAKIISTWDTTPYDRPTCQFEKATLDLPAAAPSKARHVSVVTRWSWGIVAASARGTLPSVLERLPERPMTSALIEELKTMATEAKRSQREDAEGSSWAVQAAEEDPHGRGIGTLLVEAGGGGGGGKRGGREKRGGEGGHGGECDEQREQWEDPLATHPDGEIELRQTNRGPGGVCVGIVPRVQSKLPRAFHAHRGKMLLQDFQTLASAVMNRAMVRFRVM